MTPPCAAPAPAARALILLREEHAEVLADDLVGAIPLHPLSFGRPAGHVAARIEQENRVVADVLDQQPVAFFALAQRLRSAALGAGVMDHLEECIDVTGFIPDRGHDPVRGKAAAILTDIGPLVVRPAA